MGRGGSAGGAGTANGASGGELATTVRRGVRRTAGQGSVGRFLDRGLLEHGFARAVQSAARSRPRSGRRVAVALRPRVRRGRASLGRARGPLRQDAPHGGARVRGALGGQRAGARRDAGRAMGGHGGGLGLTRRAAGCRPRPARSGGEAPKPAGLVRRGARVRMLCERTGTASTLVVVRMRVPIGTLAKFEICGTDLCS